MTSHRATESSENIIVCMKGVLDQSRAVIEVVHTIVLRGLDSRGCLRMSLAIVNSVVGSVVQAVTVVIKQRVHMLEAIHHTC